METATAVYGDACVARYNQAMSHGPEYNEVEKPFLDQLAGLGGAAGRDWGCERYSLFRWIRQRPACRDVNILTAKSVLPSALEFFDRL